MKVILLNENIIYVDYLESYLDIANDKIPKIIRKILYKILNKIGRVNQDKNLVKMICQENDNINKKMINNLIEKIKKLNLKNIVLPEILNNNSQFISILKEDGYNILDGRWLYKFLAYDIVEKIAYVKNVKISDMEITILSNADSDINIEIIKELAQKCKILNIVTDKINMFQAVENFLFDEYGINITVSRNKQKTCLHSDLVLNLDFKNNLLKKCKLKKKSILVQFTKEKFENKNGATIVFYKMNMPVKYSRNIENNGHFSEEILYESFLYYKTSYINIRKILEKDNFEIRYFIGNNGKIPFQELKTT